MIKQSFTNLLNNRVVKTYAFQFIGFAVLTITPFYLITARPASDIKILGIFEGTILFILGAVNLGLVTDANRKIALYPKKWKSYFERCQRIRLFIAIVIVIISVLYFVLNKNERFLLGIIAIPVALSGEYAFYAKGRSVEASKALIIKNSIYSSILVFSTFHKEINFSYLIIISSFLSYLISGIYTATKLKVNYFPPLKRIKYNYFKEMLFISFAIIIYQNFRNIFILLLGNHLLDIDYVYFYEVFKIYMLAFLFKRSLHQIFYSQIINNVKSFKYDFIVFFSLLAFNLSLLIVSFIINSFFQNISILDSIVVRDSIILITSISILSSYLHKALAIDKNKLLIIPPLVIIIFLLLGITSLNYFQSKINYYIYLLASIELSLSIIGTIFNGKYINKLS